MLHETAIKRVVRLSRYKTEAKCLFDHYPSPPPAEIFSPTAASQLARPVTANCGCWSTVPELFLLPWRQHEAVPCSGGAQGSAIS